MSHMSSDSGDGSTPTELIFIVASGNIFTDIPALYRMQDWEGFPFSSFQAIFTRTQTVITPTPITTNVRVGVGVLVHHAEHPGFVLIGRRKGSHGSGSLALPGGHLEVNESVAQCAVREVEEECNLALDSTSVRLVGVTQDVFSESAGKHYVTLIVIATVLPTSPLLENMEPHKCEAWEWITLEALAQRRAECFLPLQHALDTFLMKPGLLTQGLSGGLKMNEDLRQ